MILEGIVTTQSADGVLNVAPMGPIVDVEMTTLHLRPFQTSTTYKNLKQHAEGVLHVVDDVLLLAQSAIGKLEESPEVFPAEHVRGSVLSCASRWYEFQVTELDDREERTSIHAKVVHSGRLKDFFGFNRAKHAVLEAAILATRIGILPTDEIRADFERLAIIVRKTAGEQETAAFELLQRYFDAKAKTI